MRAHKLSTLNPEIQVFRCKGGLFDVSPNNLHANLQREVRYKRELLTKEFVVQNGTVSQDCTFRLVAVQKDYAGNLVYRGVIVSDKGKRESWDDFGRCLSSDEIEFLD